MKLQEKKKPARTEDTPLKEERKFTPNPVPILLYKCYITQEYTGVKLTPFLVYTFLPILTVYGNHISIC